VYNDGARDEGQVRPSRVLRDYRKRQLVGLWVLGLGLSTVLTLGIWWGFRVQSQHQREQAAYERANGCHPTTTTKSTLLPHRIGKIQTYTRIEHTLWRCEKTGQEYWK